MTLKSDDRKSLVELRIEKSFNALQDAQLLADNGRWPAAANRLYYAAYYAVSALLLKNGLSVKTHEGVIQLFGLHFVKPGIVDSSQGKLYSNLFSLRLTGDYDDDFNLTEEDVLPKMKNTESFIKKIVELTINN